MHIISSLIQSWLRRLAAPARAADPTERMSLRELADLPPYHPRRDGSGGCPAC